MIEVGVRQFMPMAPAGTILATDPVLALGCLSFVAVMGAVAGLFPAWRAASLSPTAAMRTE
jgi:putative ABC transport system permease protein